MMDERASKQPQTLDGYGYERGILNMKIRALTAMAFVGHICIGRHNGTVAAAREHMIDIHGSGHEPFEMGVCVDENVVVYWSSLSSCVCNGCHYIIDHISSSIRTSWEAGRFPRF
jgi:hypothetical protein